MSDPTCNDFCLTGGDVGVPGPDVAFPHPECPLHGTPELLAAETVTVSRAGYDKLLAATKEAGGLAAARARIAQLEAGREMERTMLRNAADRITELEAVTGKVRDHIDQRPECIEALKNSPGMADYYRWSGGAEARRQLATDLDWTVPHEVGDKTTPKTDMKVKTVE